jgi:hypothetical protein
LIFSRLAGAQGGTDDEAMSTAAGSDAGTGHPEPCLSVAAVDRRLGVAPATLRTWDRRYGVGPTRHSAGEHRRYAPADVARPEALRRLVPAGVPPSDAARLAVDRVRTGRVPTRPAAGPVPAAVDAIRQIVTG